MDLAWPVEGDRFNSSNKVDEGVDLAAYKEKCCLSRGPLLLLYFWMVSVRMERSSSRNVALISYRPAGVCRSTISSLTLANFSPGWPSTMCDAMRSFLPDSVSVILLLIMVLSVLRSKNHFLSSYSSVTRAPDKNKSWIHAKTSQAKFANL